MIVTRNWLVTLLLYAGCTERGLPFVEAPRQPSAPLEDMNGVGVDAKHEVLATDLLSAADLRALDLGAVDMAVAPDLSSPPDLLLFPIAPTAVSACARDSFVTVSWMPVDGADAYNVYSAAATPVAQTAANRIATVTPWVEVPGPNDAPLHIVVTTVKKGLESEPSAEATATPRAVTQSHDVVVAVSTRDPSATEVWVGFESLASGSPSTFRCFGGSSGITYPIQGALFFDLLHGSTYLSDSGANTVHVWDDGWYSGGKAGDRTIVGVPVKSYRSGTVVDTRRQILYVAYDGGVAAYRSACTVDGAVPPDLVLEGPSTNILTPFLPHGLALDEERDDLYVTNYRDILVFHGLGSAVGPVDRQPDRIISVQGETLTTHGVALDLANDLVYLTSREQGAIFELTGAHEADGTMTAVRTFPFANPTAVSRAGSWLCAVTEFRDVGCWDLRSAGPSPGAPTKTLVSSAPFGTQVLFEAVQYLP
jgi:hypothetical protein